MATLIPPSAIQACPSKIPRSHQTHTAKAPVRKEVTKALCGNWPARVSSRSRQIGSMSPRCSSAREKKLLQHGDDENNAPLIDTPVVISSLQRRQRAKLVKHSTPQLRSPTPVVMKQAEDAGAEELLYYRCDIHPVNSTDFAAATAECRQLVIEAGGKVLDEYEYLSGFLYTLFPATTNPLDNGDASAAGGHIEISAWTTPFKRLILSDDIEFSPRRAPSKRPVLDGLRMNPPGSPFMSLGEGK